MSETLANVAMTHNIQNHLRYLLSLIFRAMQKRMKNEINPSEFVGDLNSNTTTHEA